MARVFDFIYEPATTQLGNEPAVLKDDENISALRRAKTKEDMLKLCDALNYQLRYKESLKIYDELIAIYPQDRHLYRLRAPRFINTLQPKPAIKDFLKYREMGDEDPADTSYRLGIAYYLDGQYEKCIEEEAFAYSNFDEEMGIACMFWHTLACWELGIAPTIMEKDYHTGMKVGHHYTYDTVMALVTGKLSLPESLGRLYAKESDLDFAIIGYGFYKYFKHIGNTELADNMLKDVIKRNHFWIAYAYIAAWNDAKNA